MTTKAKATTLSERMRAISAEWPRGWPRGSKRPDAATLKRRAQQQARIERMMHQEVRQRGRLDYRRTKIFAALWRAVDQVENAAEGIPHGSLPIWNAIGELVVAVEHLQNRTCRKRVRRVR